MRAASYTLGPLTNLGDLLSEHPYAEDYFRGRGLPIPKPGIGLGAYLASFSDPELEELGLKRDEVAAELADFLAAGLSLLGAAEFRVETLTVLPGRDKEGKNEISGAVELKAGDVVSVVGRTGSGKSRFLADIESLANGDTPSRRVVLVNGMPVPPAYRYSAERKLVAQLSQNMNFIMDVPVGKFLELHAGSRMADDIDGAVRKTIEQANELAGERFSAETQLTQLSGGQSRALMIADTAIISSSPIVLIDEIENAGVDRRKALSLFTDSGKIVVVATHDPLLALMAPKRLVIRNGAVAARIDTAEDERAILSRLLEYDALIQGARNALRDGFSLGGNMDSIL